MCKKMAKKYLHGLKGLMIPDLTPRKVFARDVKQLRMVYGGDIQNQEI